MNLTNSNLTLAGGGVGGGGRGSGELVVSEISWEYGALSHQLGRLYTDKKKKKIYLIYKEIQSGAFAKSYMRKGFLIYEEMGKYFPIYEEAVSHI